MSKSKETNDCCGAGRGCSFLAGFAVGVAVPCLVVILADRQRRRRQVTLRQSDDLQSHRLFYDDGSLEPELRREYHWQPF